MLIPIQLKLAASEPEDDDLEIGEFQVAEYIIFLLALDTYQRYAEETAGIDDVEDSLIKRGLKVLRLADTQIDQYREYLETHLTKPSQISMLRRALNLKVFNPAGAARRALQFRTILTRGGTQTVKGILDNPKYVRQVKTAISASMLEDADKALDVFAAIPLLNIKMRAWIDAAAKQSGSGTFAPSPVDSASNEVAASTEIKSTSIKEVAEAGAQSTQVEQESRAGMIHKVQVNATEAARKSLEVNQQQDEPPKESKVVGIATAAAVAAISDPSLIQNIPIPLRDLDEEQRSAALTGGRVRVAAGAGSGKSTTLVARIDYLVKDGRVNPARVMACSFNRKAALELKEKIAKKVGSGAAGIQVGTMHSLFAKLIVGTRDTPGFGTQEEQAMLRPPRLIAPSGRGVKSISPASLSQTIRNMWVECGPDSLVSMYKYPRKWVEEPPKAKKAGLLLNAWRGNDVTLEQAKALVTSKAEAQAYIWYEMYLGLKGDIPGWRPPCADSKPYSNFMNRNRKGGERLGDLDDMLKILRDILKRDPKAKAIIQGMYDHILVDECVHVDSVVTTNLGTKLSGNLVIDDQVLSFENGSAVFKKVIGVKKSRKRTGLTIRTKSGRELSVTDEHKLYATEFESTLIPEGCLALYLMYRADKGFRIGVTTDPIGRPRQEKADRLWVLEIGEESEILFKEQAYSLRYKIPTYVFEASIRGCDQERVDRIFDEFGSNGKELLTHYGLSVDYPHWVSTCYSGTNRHRFVIHLMAHRKGGYGGVRTCGCCSRLSFSWTPGEFSPRVAGYEVRGGRKMASFASPCYTKVREQAVNLTNKVGATLWETILFEDRSLALTTAKALYPGMHLLAHKSGKRVDIDAILKSSDLRKIAKDLGFEVPFRGSISWHTYLEVREKQISLGVEPLPIPDTSEFELDEITEVIPTSGAFVDISVEDTANFFANGILNHNCQDLNTVQHQIFAMMSEQITQDSKDKSVWMVGDSNQAIYGFRGAKPELFENLEEGWTTRNIRTNYRCQPEIVEAANTLISHEGGGVLSMADPRKDRGRASIQVSTPEDNVEAAIETIGRYRQEIDGGSDAENFAVLARTNAELNDFETACIINEIPYIRRGGKGFLEAPESRAVLGFIDLASGNDYAKMKKSLVAALMKPDRALFLGPDDVEKAIDEALHDVARQERVDVNSVRPDLLLESKYVRLLADKLKQPYKLRIMASAKGDTRKGDWMYKNRVDEMEDNLRGMAANLRDLRVAIDDNRPTEELLNYVLDNMQSKVTSWDRSLGRNVTEITSLRQQITNDVAIFSDDEDDVDEDDKDSVPPPELGEEGVMPTKEKAQTAKGLGSVQFLFALSKPNKSDLANLTDPSVSQGFASKIERYSKVAESLRVDPDQWERDQQKLSPAARREKPEAVSLSTVHCSPPDEPILTTGGWVPIGQLDPSDHRLASYDDGCNQLRWGDKSGKSFNGFQFLVSSRQYSGDLIVIQTGKTKTRVTPNHRIRVRFSDSFNDKYVVYLMRRGDWWRIGICVSAHRPYRSAGVGGRLATEQADAGWILSVHNTKEEAAFEEARIQAFYGVPGITFEAAKNRFLTSAQLQLIHDSSKEVVAPRALNLLSVYGLDPKEPLYRRELGYRASGSAFTIKACNLLGCYMEIPVIPDSFVNRTGGYESWFKPEWLPITVTREKFGGKVYSLVVVPHHYYVSGGAVVHNSVKGAQWKNVTVLMPKGLFPMERKPKPDEPPPDPVVEAARMKAERNLAYVALTRAKVNLEVTCPMTKGVSPFVFQAGLTPGENVKKPSLDHPAEEVTVEASTPPVWTPAHIEEF